MNDDIKAIPLENLTHVVLVRFHITLCMFGKIQSVFFKGIGKIVDVFLSVGGAMSLSSAPSSSVAPSTFSEKHSTVAATAKTIAPSGNTILDMFGDMLFEAALTTGGGIEADDARAEAYATLCHIFQSVQYRKMFKKEYLARFYYCITWASLILTRR